MKALGTILLILAVLGIAYTGWRVKRWVNWKFSYGDKVELRLEQLEKRVDILESK